MEKPLHHKQEVVRRIPMYYLAIGMLAISMVLGGCGPKTTTSPELCSTTEGYTISCDDMEKPAVLEAIDDFIADLEYGGLDNALQYEEQDPNPPIKQLFQRLIPGSRPVPQWNSRLKEGFRQWIEKILSGDQKTVTETNQLIDEVTDGFPTLGIPESLPGMND
ncbi:MAG: hypothetical protein WC489_05020 [Patescibacteria group bacterium]